MADKWEDLKEGINARCAALEHDNRKEIEETRRAFMAEIESAKNDSVLDELKKLGERIGRLEAKIPEPEPEVED